MAKIINGIQQIGIGVADAKSVFNWYREHLGFDILVFEDIATADLMTQYTNHKVERRHALLSLNMKGGGGLEIWQFTGRIPTTATTPFLLGDLGINSMKIRATNVLDAHTNLSVLKLEILGALRATQDGKPHFFFQDPWGNLVEVVQDDYLFSETNSVSGGVIGTVIGVSDMDRALPFYQQILGYDVQASDRTGSFEDFKELPGGAHAFRRVLLKHRKRSVGGFGELLGPTEIELLQVLDREPVKIYKDRLWGDLGYIHLCFDINGMEMLRDEAKNLGFPFTVDSADSFDMGDAAGHFSYIEDPDGTLIEFVETHKVPILKKLGIFINLKKRNPLNPLPKWLVKAMQVHRVKRNL